MKIDEAIAHARKVANEKYLEGILCHANPNDEKLDDCIECAREHEQLAEWLEELKAYREIGTVEECKNSVLDILKAYNKTIDDFVNQFNVIVDEKCGTDTNNYFRKIVKEIAEQLKVGGENEIR